MKYTKAELIQHVRDHAVTNYEQGWDILVECWNDDEIAAAISKARTPAGAIRNVWRELSPLVEYRQEIQSA